MNNMCWLPEMVFLSDYQNDWHIYETVLYSIFKSDFIDDPPSFEGKQVNIRRHPIEYNKEEAFFHITCQDYLKDGQRVPDLRRCERIKWPRSYIENYQCDAAKCDSCDGIKVWSEPYKNTSRVHMLFENERYMVVLERRDSYCLLITAFYFNHNHALQKKLKHYEMFTSQNQGSHEAT